MTGAVVPGRRSPVAAWWVCGALLLAWVALLAMVLTGKGLAQDDGAVLGWLVGHRSGGLTDVLRAVSSTGPDGAAGLLGAAVVGLVAVRTRSLRPVVVLGAAVAGGVVVAELVKPLVGRARPSAALMLGTPESGSGFPSAHTLVLTAGVGAVALVVCRAASSPAVRLLTVAVAVVVSAVMGLSRLYLGDHWLTDVLAAYVLAGAVLAAVATLTTPSDRGAQADQVVSGGRR